MNKAAEMAWFGHATIRLTLPDERVVLIDPWLRDNPSCPDNLKTVERCDFIALTHGHGDHTGDVARLIEQHNPQVVATVELCAHLGMQSQQGRFAPMNIGGTQIIDGVSFSLTRAYHSSSVDSESGPLYAGMPAGVVIDFDGLSPFYHAGDTDVFSDMKLIADIFAPRVVALPIGDHFTMGPVGAAHAATLFQPANIIPIHYGTFPVLHGTPDAFRDALPEALKPRLVVPAAGESIPWTENGLSR
jgi:L-ascorbate metabolism protein UlaG (beta-lactamase superfamily)